MHQRTEFQLILPCRPGELCIKLRVVREKNLVSPR